MIANYSVAMGSGTIARGGASAAWGTATTASGTSATAWGNKTVASGPHATAAGDSSVASGENSLAVGGGAIAIGHNSVALGNRAVASGFASTALGHGSSATGPGATALGTGAIASGNGAVAIGSGITAGGQNSTALGRLASTNNQVGSFVYGDNSTTTDGTFTTLLSSGSNRFEVRAQNIWLGANSTITYPAGAYLATSTGAYLTTGGAWTNSSDRAAKTDVAPLRYREVLERVVAMPVSSWRYKSESESVRHIGPMAQDFQRAFALSSDSTHIATVDADGVALAAIKGLYETMREELDATHEVLEAVRTENAELRRKLDQLTRRVQER